MAITKAELELQIAALAHKLIAAKATLREARKRVEEIETQYNEIYETLRRMKP